MVVRNYGVEGRGNGALADLLEPKPINFTSFAEMRHIPDSLMFYSIQHGVMGSAMPKHAELNKKQV